MKISKIYKNFLILNLIIGITISFVFCFDLFSNSDMQMMSVGGYVFTILYKIGLAVLWPLVLLYAIKKKDKLGFSILFILGIIYMIIILFTAMQQLILGNQVDYFNILSVIYSVIIFKLLINEFKKQDDNYINKWNFTNVSILIITVILIINSLYVAVNLVLEYINLFDKNEEIISDNVSANSSYELQQEIEGLEEILVPEIDDIEEVQESNNEIESEEGTEENLNYDEDIKIINGEYVEEEPIVEESEYETINPLDNSVVIKQYEINLETVYELILNKIANTVTTETFLLSTTGDITADTITIDEFKNNISNYIQQLNNRTDLFSIYKSSNSMRFSYEQYYILEAIGLGSHMGIGLVSEEQTVEVNID